MPLLQARQLSRTFSSGGTPTHALRNATFSISAGEFVAIMGPSGSGKSTLLHILGLLDRQTAGEYILDGTDTARLNDEQRARLRNQKLGFVFQAFHLLARATVRENIMLPLYYSATPENKFSPLAEAAADQVGLAHRLNYTPAQLSGGEKQRVAIARALVNAPDIIFADEPTGNLDSKTGRAVMQLIDNLHQAGHTIIVITHELAVAGYAQRIITMADGLITADQVVTRSHQHQFSK